MLGIGILALLGTGVLAMAMGGGGDDAEPETVEDPVVPEDEDVTMDPLDIAYVPPEDVDAETEERINA